MERQHTENLFRRYKGQLVKIKTIAGGEYEGFVEEVTNDYVLLSYHQQDDKTQTVVLFTAIESFVLNTAT